MTKINTSDLSQLPPNFQENILGGMKELFQLMLQHEENPTEENNMINGFLEIQKKFQKK